MTLRLPRVPPGKILVNKKWSRTALGRDLMTNHGGVEFSFPEDVVDFVPAQNLPVLLFDSEEWNGTNNSVAKIKRFKEVWKEVEIAVVVAERNSSCLQMYNQFQEMATLKKDLNVIPVATLQEVPALLKDLLYTHTHPQNNHFVVSKDQPVDLASKQLHLLTLIPNVGRTKAQSLLHHFYTLKRISYANEQELSAIVGTACAASVYNFFNDDLSLS